MAAERGADVGDGAVEAALHLFGNLAQRAGLILQLGDSSKQALAFGMELGQARLGVFGFDAGVAERNEPGVERVQGIGEAFRRELELAHRAPFLAVEIRPYAARKKGQLAFSVRVCPERLHSFQSKLTCVGESTMNMISSYIREFRRNEDVGHNAVQDELDIADKNRASVLPWRGQFSPQLVEHLLKRYLPGTVLDPFCGGASVLYEGAALGWEGTGIDVNPAAVVLASFSQYCGFANSEREAVYFSAEKHLFSALDAARDETFGLDFVKHFGPALSPLQECLLLLAYGDKPNTTTSQLLRALKLLRTRLWTIPHTKRPLQVNWGDARKLDEHEGVVDLVVTSPPYINVFNYHQHYRPVMEGLGYRPLDIAGAEIGSNRKHRQNRFLTVIQYCLDIEAVLTALRRAIKPHAEVIFVVGRSSNVRGIKFYNGELIAAIAELGGLFSIKKREWRRFLSRFGESIVEDVLTLHPASREASGLVGRDIAAQALISAMSDCSDPEICRLIAQAFEMRESVRESSYGR